MANELFVRAATLPQIPKRCEDRYFAFRSQLVKGLLNLQRVLVDVEEHELASEDVETLRHPISPTQEHQISSCWVPRPAQVPTNSSSMPVGC